MLIILNSMAATTDAQQFILIFFVCLKNRPDQEENNYSCPLSCHYPIFAGRKIRKYVSGQIFVTNYYLFVRFVQFSRRMIYYYLNIGYIHSPKIICIFSKLSHSPSPSSLWIRKYMCLNTIWVIGCIG